MRSVAPPSVLPSLPKLGISPTRGEIGRYAGVREPPALEKKRRGQSCQSPPKWGRCPAGQRGAPQNANL
ncbi:MAG: hypothetical protein E5X65_10955 [Mesorhizobium sp.]|nr:MAG: hypothetical protein E5X65_10955 [Mesorhizobium sp.]